MSIQSHHVPHILDPLLQTNLSFLNSKIFCENDTFLSISMVIQKILVLREKLTSIGMQMGDHVAIALPRGVEAAISIYAILSLGGVYVPLDIHSPSNRLIYIIKDAGIKYILGHSIKAEWCPNVIGWVDVTVSLTKKSLKEPFFLSSGGENIATILYTSGSTGHPKGIALSHRALCSFSDWAEKTFSVNSNDIVASLTPFSFDLSIFDLFIPLRSGAYTTFIPEGLTISPTKMTEWLATKEITIWYTVPSILIFLGTKGNLSKIPLPKLHSILFAGEVFPINQLKLLSKLLPHTSLYNLFGPTETNVCAYWRIDRTKLEALNNIPIGSPASFAQLKVDHSNHELLVRGPALMTGYWQNKMIKNVFDRDGWYRTGDRVSKNSKGEYLYEGRLDRMLKYGGYRIEPNEIENVICNFPNIRECAVIGLKNKADQIDIIAYIVNEVELDRLEFNNFLRSNLPSYMLPVRFRYLDSVPRLHNGKIDLKGIERLELELC